MYFAHILVQSSNMTSFPAESASPSKQPAPPEAPIVPGIPEAQHIKLLFISLLHIYIAFKNKADFSVFSADSGKLGVAV